ncbi:DeoR/GlpR family DNA-binding transcription regulator [Paenibacillus sp. KQZ6P-2]|uniref:DeoR/GlpR family DNA-binding transcription regulator n=1 Tax=Paenibacillus mangrovi TaxID=2931978 RepID=A0A9X1WSN8_9BACL|nr:DeoR/GlpR family DNA-binding transcription regulator [Paenibacillus mangrovi]MCJ8011014.1 DeoR/GlpR family DNA-binding transcription regulator [Paenibacillus mangrovi]
MFTQERRDKILELLGREGRVLAKDLADQFEVSIDSIRRDLSIMEEEKLLKRTHGGAIPLPNVRKLPHPPSERYGEGNVYQNAIAKQAAAYISENETVFIGGAAIHFVLLKYLPKHFHFTVVTNSLKIADTLKDAEHIQTYLIGGKIKPSGNMTDALANSLASQFTIDLSFATGGGLSVKGLSTATPEVASFSRTIAENSRRNICLAEHYQFGIDFFARMYPLKALNMIITDEETSKEEIAKIEACGVKVIVAESK